MSHCLQAVTACRQKEEGRGERWGLKTESPMPMVDLQNPLEVHKKRTLKEHSMGGGQREKTDSLFPKVKV